MDELKQECETKGCREYAMWRERVCVDCAYEAHTECLQEAYCGMTEPEDSLWTS